MSELEWNLACPHCGALHDRHTDATRASATPVDGDLSMCIDCGEFAVFDLGERRLRAPTIDEANDIDSDPDMLLYRIAWRKMKDDNSH